VLGVFSTPGWLSILAVGGTLGGVVVTQGVTAVIRRGDRRQERALDWERRVWQAKSDALTRLISACRFIKWRVQQAEADKPGDENYRRGAAIRALDLFRGRIGDEDGISEVTAYGAEPVCKALEEVLKEVRVQQGKHGASLSALGPIGDRLYRLGKEEPLEDVPGAEGQQHSEQYNDLMSQRAQVFVAIGSASNLDVDKVIRLCNHVIDVAKRDLQAGYSYTQQRAWWRRVLRR